MKNNKKTTTILPNDFERMIPEYHEGTIIYGEHVVRYDAAKELVRGKTVLDIASGSGYGTKLLASTAKHVYGVDVFDDAVEYAKQNYGAKNITYKKGDGTRIPLEDNTVDMVVSFETIEHIEDYETFMAEVGRVLKPDGLFVLSTPNDIEFAEGNHFHVHEFEHKELKDLVGRHFSNIKEYFQADWVYSGIHSKDELIEEWDKKQRIVNLLPLKLDQALYFFMLCSNRKIVEKLDSFGTLSEHWSAKVMQNKDNLTQNHIKNIQDISDGREQYIKELQAVIVSKDEELARLNSKLLVKLGNKIQRKS